MSTYRERREARAERLEGWAGKRQESAAATFASHEKYHGDTAFNTQPGHIPARARRIAADDRAHASLQKAAGMSQRAATIRSQMDHAIYSDDEDAIPRLEEKIAALEAKRAQITASNAAFRKAVKAAGLPKVPLWQAADYDGHHQYPSYEASNLGGNITRAKQRLADLQRAAKRAEPAPAEESDDTSWEIAPGGLQGSVFSEHAPPLKPGQPQQQGLFRTMAQPRGTNGKWVCEPSYPRLRKSACGCGGGGLHPCPVAKKMAPVRRAAKSRAPRRLHATRDVVDLERELYGVDAELAATTEHLTNVRDEIRRNGSIRHRHSVTRERSGRSLGRGYTAGAGKGSEAGYEALLRSRHELQAHVAHLRAERRSLISALRSAQRRGGAGSTARPQRSAAHHAEAPVAFWRRAGQARGGDEFTVGERVRMTWTGGTRDGVVAGPARPDRLPTGSVFVPVTWDGGGSDNVDSRVLSPLGQDRRDDKVRAVWDQYGEVEGTLIQGELRPGEDVDRIAHRGFYGSGIRSRAAAQKDIRRRFGSAPAEAPVTRAGARFYVTARSGGQTAFLLGPYVSHMTAQAHVPEAKRRLRDEGHDFASVGTASTPETVQTRWGR